MNLEKLHIDSPKWNLFFADHHEGPCLSSHPCSEYDAINLEDWKRIYLATIERNPQRPAGARLLKFVLENFPDDPDEVAIEIPFGRDEFSNGCDKIVEFLKERGEDYWDKRLLIDGRSYHEIVSHLLSSGSHKTCPVRFTLNICWGR